MLVKPEDLFAKPFDVTCLALRKCVKSVGGKGETMTNFEWAAHDQSLGTPLRLAFVAPNPVNIQAYDTLGTGQTRFEKFHRGK